MWIAGSTEISVTRSLNYRRVLVNADDSNTSDSDYCAISKDLAICSLEHSVAQTRTWWHVSFHRNNSSSQCWTHNFPASAHPFLVTLHRARGGIILLSLVMVHQLFRQVTSFKNPPSVDYQNNNHQIVWCEWLPPARMTSADKAGEYDKSDQYRWEWLVHDQAWQG